MPQDVVRSILVASDLSGSSDEVVRAAAELAEQTGATLHVLHAIEVLGRPLLGATFDLLRLQGVIHESRAGLHDQLGRVVSSAARVGSVELDYKTPSVAILQRAKEVQAGLIVIGPHRPGAPGSDMLGTTAQRVVEEATVPCLVARGPLPSPLRRVLLPVGEVDVRRGLLAAAGHWLAGLRQRQEAQAATRHAAELRVLHVVRTPFAWRDFSEELSQEIRALTHRADFGAHFHLHRSIAWSKCPATEILRIAEEARVDLVAMGVRGHGPLMRALPGSVSSTVLRRAAAPVLLLPPRMCERWASHHAPRPAGPAGGTPLLEVAMAGKGRG